MPVNLQYSARKLFRTPGLTLALLLTIALGIGSNVSVYGFARGLLSRPDAPLTSLDRVVSIFAQDTVNGPGPLSYEEYLSVRSCHSAFQWIGAAQTSPASIALSGQSAIVSVAAITSGLASALNLSFGKGVIVSHRLWGSEVGGNANVLGDRIRVDGTSFRVSGVAPNWLEGVYRDRPIDVWMPLKGTALEGADRATRNIWVVAQLRPNVSTTRAQNAIHSSRKGPGEMIVLPYRSATPEMAQGMARIGTLLEFAAGAVLLIACVNVTCFLLGRAFARSRETSLRVAIGARRRQLAAQLIWDSIVISAFGGALGILLAVWTARVVPALLFEEDAERLVFAPGLFTIIAASAACVAITIVCGLMPVFVTSDDRPAAILQRESGGPSKATSRLRMVLVVLQMASCCALVLSTAFLLDSFRAALKANVGQSLGEPVLVSVQAQPQLETDITYFQHVEQVVKSMAGVSAMAWTGQLPGSQPAWQSFRIEPPQLPLREVKLEVAGFTTESLKLFTLPPRAGRLFSFEDEPALQSEAKTQAMNEPALQSEAKTQGIHKTCRVAVVDEPAAAELFGRETVGRVVQDAAGMPVEIIGVLAKKTRNTSKAGRPTIYYNDLDGHGLQTESLTPTFHVPIVSELAHADLATNSVSPGYFKALRLFLLAGQGFTDARMPGECRVGIVNREAAGLYFGSRAVGSAIIDDRGVRTTIIGVVQSRPFGIFQRHAEPAIYFPMWRDCPRTMTLIAAVRKMKAPILSDLRRRIESVPGRGPAPVIIRTLATQLAHTALAPLRIATVILAASATTGLALSILGLFAALNDAARQRRRELAIRIALGAPRWRIVCHVLSQGGQLACAGAVIGTLGSFALRRLLLSISAGNSSPPLWVWLAAPLVLGLAVVIASVLPTRRASTINPVTILRDEN